MFPLSVLHYARSIFGDNKVHQFGHFYAFLLRFLRVQAACGRVVYSLLENPSRLFAQGTLHLSEIVLHVSNSRCLLTSHGKHVYGTICKCFGGLTDGGTGEILIILKLFMIRHGLCLAFVLPV